MTRSLAWLFVALVGLAGAAATPSRVVESARLVATIARFDADRATRPDRSARTGSARVSAGSVAIALAAPASAPARSALVTHALFQRPPPLQS